GRSSCSFVRTRSSRPSGMIKRSRSSIQISPVYFASILDPVSAEIHFSFSLAFHAAVLRDDPLLAAMLDSGSPRRLRTLGYFGARLPDSGDRPPPLPQSRPD